MTTENMTTSEMISKVANLLTGLGIVDRNISLDTRHNVEVTISNLCYLIDSRMKNGVVA